MTILITGNPVDGFVFYGPFDTPEEAIATGERMVTGDWWIAILHPSKDLDA